MLTTALTVISLPDALGLSVLGIVVVFAVLIVLMFVINLLSRAFGNNNNNKDDSNNNLLEQVSEPVQSVSAQTTPVQTASAQTNQQASVNSGLAPGSAGEIKLNNVADKQAAMVMAIVADHLKTPLNQLRFKSIKRLD